jgi:outer membrane murein-binding lipoprotein Lpp
MTSKRIVLAVLVIGLLSSVFLAGCSLKEQVTKVNLPVQLNKINDEVARLNQGTEELGGIIAELDAKESSLGKQVELLKITSAKVAEQSALTDELLVLTTEQKAKIGKLLGTGQTILGLMGGLEAGTGQQVTMSATTLSLITVLKDNLGTFIDLNNVLAGKLGQALEIMKKM